MTAEIRPHPALLTGIDDESGTVNPRTDPDPIEAEQRATEVLGAHAVDGNLAIGHGREPDEAADFDVIGTDGVGGSSKGPAPLDHIHVGPDPFDGRAERHQESGKILDVGLARRVPERGATPGGDGRHQRVLGPGDARLVEEDVPASERLGLELVSIADGDRRAQLFQGEEVGIDAAAADDVAAGRRQRNFAEAREQWPGEQNGGSNPRAELGIERLETGAASIEPHRVGTGPLDGRAEIRQQREHGLDVADAGHVFQRNGAVGEQRRSEDRERGVLVPRGTHGSPQGSPATNPKA